MSTTRLTGLYAMVAGAASLLFAPLLALAYFATADGAEDLDVETVSAWADPAGELAGGLLTWASPDRVYATYLQALTLLIPAMFLCARVVRARRPVSGGRLERVSWRIALTGYAVASVGALAAFVVMFASDPTNAALEAVFLGLMVPGTLITVIGSTVLGIALLRADFRPRFTAVLLTLTLPFQFVGSDVLGHNSLGMVPLLIAWAAAGRDVWRGR